MNNEKPRDPLYPKGFDETKEFKKEIRREYSKPAKKDDELSPLKKLNHKLGIYLHPKSTEINDDEKKRKIGIIITTLIITTLIISSYYFIIYEPSQEQLSLAKTTKLNELHDLYNGALTTSPNAILLENKINNARTPGEVETINVLTHATTDWKSYHTKSINLNQDKYNRTMIVYSNTNDTDSNFTSNNATPEISGCTVLSIMRYEENGEIESEYSKSTMEIEGNNTHPHENTKSFSSDVLELIKGSIINGSDENETFELLKSYGVK